MVTSFHGNPDYMRICDDHHGSNPTPTPASGREWCGAGWGRLRRPVYPAHRVGTLASPCLESITKTSYPMGVVARPSTAMWLPVTTDMANCAYPDSFTSLCARVPILLSHGHAGPIYHHRAFSLHTSALVATTGADVEYPTLWCVCFDKSCNRCTTTRQYGRA